MAIAGGPSGRTGARCASIRAPKPATFSPYREKQVPGQAPPEIGSLSNPGSAVWEDVLDDLHPYQRVPHTARVIQTLRTIGEGARPLFLSEYGIGSGVDLMRVVRRYEQLGKGDLEDNTRMLKAIGANAGGA